ncbi:hypothetical protein B0H10DRAFT_1938461 [Mycena sp. CBHHK59/15]|nr:hypothetical protein B0H10DRAFT_1938461 [Mycena sp. CBHHK59/15]
MPESRQMELQQAINMFQLKLQKLVSIGSCAALYLATPRNIAGGHERRQRVHEEFPESCTAPPHRNGYCPNGHVKGVGQVEALEEDQHVLKGYWVLRRAAGQWRSQFRNSFLGTMKNVAGIPRGTVKLVPELETGKPGSNSPGGDKASTDRSNEQR